MQPPRPQPLPIPPPSFCARNTSKIYPSRIRGRRPAFFQHARSAADGCEHQSRGAAPRRKNIRAFDPYLDARGFGKNDRFLVRCGLCRRDRNARRSPMTLLEPTIFIQGCAAALSLRPPGHRRPDTRRRLPAAAARADGFHRASTSQRKPAEPAVGV